MGECRKLDVQVSATSVRRILRTGSTQKSVIFRDPACRCRAAPYTQRLGYGGARTNSSCSGWIVATMSPVGPEQALIREVAEEACARVVSCHYLAAQHVADPLNPNGGPSYYQTRWWARVELDPWRPQHEMIARQLVAVDQVLPILCWSRKEVASRLLDLAVETDRQQ